MQIFQCEQSSVWECVHRSSGERYCVKIMDASSSALHEVSMMEAAQTHSHILNIVQVMIEDDPREGQSPESFVPPSNRCRRRRSNSSVGTSNSNRARKDQTKSSKLYLVTEWMSGGNLLSFVIQNGRLEESTVQSIAVQLLRAVDHLHNVAFLNHNDLHPANILLGRERSVPASSFFLWETVKIADFGAATTSWQADCESISDGSERSGSRNGLQDAERSRSPRMHRVANNSSQGTVSSLNSRSADSRTNQSKPHRYRFVSMASTPPLSYRAPELSKHKDLKSSGAADMWSLGAILYFCLFGHSTEQGEGALASADPQVLSDPSLSPCRQWSRLSRHAKQFLTGLLDDDPSVRMTPREALEHPWLAHMSRAPNHESPLVAPPLLVAPPVLALPPPTVNSGRNGDQSGTSEKLWCKTLKILPTVHIPWSVTCLAECLYSCVSTPKVAKTVESTTATTATKNGQTRIVDH
jgi:serine/threonine protein kinase